MVVQNDGALSVSDDGTALVLLDRLEPATQYFLRADLHTEAEDGDEVVVRSDILSGKVRSWLDTYLAKINTVNHLNVSI